MSARFVVAIDAGSTGVRALFVDHEGRVAGRAYRENEILYPAPGRVEQDAARLWEHVLEVVREAGEATGSRAGDVAAVGVTGQRSTAVVWDRKTGEPLGRALGWQDLRTSDRAAALMNEGHFVPAQAAATKLEWILENVDAAREANRRGDVLLGTIESWIVWKLTGGRAHVTDASFASASGLYDFFDPGWQAPLVEALGLPPERLPAIRGSSEVYAESMAEIFGRPVPVAGIAGDQQAAMFGQLRFEPGAIKASYGTSTMVDLHVGSAMQMSQHGAWPMVLWQIGDTTEYLLEGSLLTGGAAVRWLRDALGLLRSVPESQELAASVPDSGGVWAVPALQGIGTPYQDAAARAAIGGMSLATTRAHVVRAVLEAIALRVAEIVEALAADSPGRTVDVLRVDGGAATNDFLLQFQADVLGIPVERPETVDAAAVGAAFLAGLATGFWRDRDELARVWRLGARFEPRMAAAEREERIARFRKIVETIRTL